MKNNHLSVKLEIFMLQLHSPMLRPSYIIALLEATDVLNYDVHSLIFVSSLRFTVPHVFD